MTKEESEATQEMLAERKKIEEELISDYSPTIPHELIYELASHGDESMYGYEESVLKKYEMSLAAEKHGRLSGARGTKEKAQLRAIAVWGKNKDLLARIGVSLTVHSASHKILNEWDKRGDGGLKPSIRSVQEWYHRFIFK